MRELRPGRSDAPGAQRVKKPGALTPKQQRFVLEYPIDMNATAAAIRAGYAERSAKRIGWELPQKPEVPEAIQAAKVARSKADLLNPAPARAFCRPNN